MDLPKLLRPLQHSIAAYQSELAAQYGKQLTQLDDEKMQLEADLHELFSFDPVQHILSGGSTDKLTEVPARIEKAELIIETLDTCINRLQYTINQHNVPLRDLYSEAQKFAGAVLRGREGVIKQSAAGKQISPVETATLKGNLSGLKQTLSRISDVVGLNDKVANNLISTLVTLDNPATVMEIR